jgi:hypothetical protein
LGLLNDDDFTSDSQSPPRKKSKSSSTVRKLIPNDSQFYGSEDTNVGLNVTEGVSVVSGNSDLDSDLGSPTPKHIVLRAKPNKSSPYMFVRPPKIGKSLNEIYLFSNFSKRFRRIC